MEEVRVGGMRFALDLSQPLYEQVLDQVRSSIAKGEIALGDKIPSVRELAQALKINPNTVMRAYQELERDRLTETRRGQGTYITTDMNVVEGIRSRIAEQAIDEFLTKMSSLGFDDGEIDQLLRKKRGMDDERNG
ncbi:GntR family transcriptional regulator [Cohnella sp. LGH]|uniref:GntR family transcriptional regulator n=1 Tax=Cohnella phaseoli TaxID=456490 RepID=A0A3D9KTL7_9BACL|nr:MULTISPECIES: GntR family transcriptional regulator [Cohnella]QTH44658.1 GntR family transcriptional regulator [Cohnella sp. LGH]RED89348.1 GntR family transcriptional regulator [Cohnella phaseoli]